MAVNRSKQQLNRNKSDRNPNQTYIENLEKQPFILDEIERRTRFFLQLKHLQDLKNRRGVLHQMASASVERDFAIGLANEIDDSINFIGSDPDFYIPCCNKREERWAEDVAHVGDAVSLTKYLHLHLLINYFSLQRSI